MVEISRARGGLRIIGISGRDRTRERQQVVGEGHIRAGRRKAVLLERRQRGRRDQRLGAGLDLAGSGDDQATMRRQHAIAVDRIAEPIADRIDLRVRVEHQPEAQQPLPGVIARAQPGLADRLAHRLGVAKDRLVLDV